MKASGLIMGAAIAALSATAAHADLAGDTLEAFYIYPTDGAIYQDLGSFTVPGGGHIYSESYSADAASITVTADDFGVFWTDADFNGLKFVDLTKDPHITGVTFDASSNAAGAGLSDASFTSNSVEFNFQGQGWAPNAHATFDLQFGSGGAPEPAAWALMLLGFGGMGAVLRSRRARTALTA